MSIKYKKKCFRKKAFLSFQKALEVCISTYKLHVEDGIITPYQCEYCTCYHVGTPKRIYDMMRPYKYNYVSMIKYCGAIDFKRIITFINHLHYVLRDYYLNDIERIFNEK